MIVFDLFELTINFEKYAIKRNKLIREKKDLTSSKNVVNAKYVKLNENQKKATNRIIEIVDNNKSLEQLFFLDDSGDTNKIFVQNIVMVKLRSENTIVLFVVFCDIATTFLNDDQTTYARFKISFDSNAQNLYNISKNSNRVRLIQQTKLIF